MDYSQQFKTAIVVTLGLLLALYVGWNIGNTNYTIVAMGALGLGAFCLAFLSGRYFWVLTVASSFLGGTFPILGGSFTPFILMMAIGVVKFLIEDVTMRRTRIKIGNRFDTLMLAAFMAVLTIHGLHDRFGMRFLGSTVWGGRNYVNVFLGLAAFFAVQSTPMPSRVWAKLPYFVLAVTSFDLVIALITTIFPDSIYKIYPFYSAVSVTGFNEVVSGESIETARLGSVGNFGVALITIILSLRPFPKIFELGNLRSVATFILGGVIALFSGFRTSVFNALAILILAGKRDLKWGVLLLLPVLAVLLLGLSLINSTVVRLPKQVQRSIIFLPGNWDADMQYDATGSNDFRASVWTLWAREYFPAHPWIGRGFGFRSEWATRSIYKYDPEEYRQMVEVGNIHNGLFATVDALGIIGATFFVVWNLRLLFRTFQVRFDPTDPNGFVMRFLALTLGSLILCYWLGATTVGSSLPQEFALAGAFLCLLRDRREVNPSVDSRQAAVAVEGRVPALGRV